MPRYFFNIIVDDDSGTELPDDVAACEQARKMFGTMIRDGELAQDAFLEVVDEDGRQITMLKFSPGQSPNAIDPKIGAPAAHAGP